ncbi:hypothetical protein BJ322DRAFT_1084282 [Thelephora terrestris]|uniref:Uncharacterized protein n=1 Tax=Thelephora terrestris TaxID=56493 RepID=A0A9P6H5N7_9AGAM|nr:hypothetical protein BJ322DRAFT_1084282 [Thelephora terrestris]
MLVGWYIKFLATFFATLLVSEHLPLIKTIGASPSEASQLLSTVSTFASEVKDNIVEMAARPSHFFHENENENENESDQSPPVSPLSPLPVAPLFESPPESPPPQPPEASPVADSTLRFWRMEGTIVIVQYDLNGIPRVDLLWKVFVWVAYWFGVLFSSGAGVSSTWRLYWVYVVAPAMLGLFGGLGYGLAGWCRGCLSRRSPKVVEKVESVVVVERTSPANSYFETQLSQSYMMPSNFQHAPDPRRLGVSTSIADTKPHAEGSNPTIDGIAKKEEDADPLMVPSSLSDSSWYSPGSPLSPTQSNRGGLDLYSYDGFQPRPRVSPPSGLPDTLMGPLPSVASPPPPPDPILPTISDPWNDYVPDDRTDLS